MCYNASTMSSGSHDDDSAPTIPAPPKPMAQPSDTDPQTEEISITFRISPALLAQIDRRAAAMKSPGAQRTSRSAYIRHVLERDVKDAKRTR